jgi:geranylgeranyl diphosphate synthase type I
MTGIASFKRRFEPQLKRFLDQRVLSFRTDTSDPFIVGLVTYAERLILHEGKRIRPYMAHLMYRAAGGRNDRAAMELFTAFETFHAFALVHDDIIDRGVTRHSLPTAHRFVASQLRSKRRRGDAEHVGEGQAILLGDHLFAWSLERMSRNPGFTDAAFKKAQACFYRMVEEVITGQMIDVDLTTRPRATRRLIDEKMRLKTAGYTFIRPLQVGAALAGAPNSVVKFCEAFGLNLGLAFQTQDDLLDLVSPASALKKTVFSDLREHQHTYFTQHIFEHGTGKQIKELRGLLGSDLTERDRPRVMRLFDSSGAFEHGTRLMDRQFDAAEKLLARSVFRKKDKLELLELVRYIRNRAA